MAVYVTKMTHVVEHKYEILKWYDFQIWVSEIVSVKTYIMEWDRINLENI